MTVNTTTGISNSVDNDLMHLGPYTPQNSITKIPIVQIVHNLHSWDLVNTPDKRPADNSLKETVYAVNRGVSVHSHAAPAATASYQAPVGCY